MRFYLDGWLVGGVRCDDYNDDYDSDDRVGVAGYLLILLFQLSMSCSYSCSLVEIPWPQ